ncbi:hypothetical protein bcCo53_001250 (plasmid) [Borrelia coriaceae]|nr:hypothetical protein [Borrelia coriaceae]UPA17081.1 hypothetical protein bcCo53_001250 [Borrelia coriaceae]
MIKIKQCSLFMIILSLIALLLVISCNQDRSAKRDGTDRATGDHTVESAGLIRKPRDTGTVGKEDLTKGDGNADLKVKINNILVAFELSDEEKQVVREIQEVVYNPDIAKYENYKTYNDRTFYKFLENLSALKVKDIIKNYLIVDQYYRYGKDLFDEAIRNATEDSSKKRLQKELEDYDYSYVFHVKKAFAHVSPLLVHSVMTSKKGGYLEYATSAIGTKLQEFRMDGAISFGRFGTLKKPDVPVGSQDTKGDDAGSDDPGTEGAGCS